MDAHKRRSSTDCNEQRNIKRNKADLYKKIEDLESGAPMKKDMPSIQAIIMALKKDGEEYSENLKKCNDNIKLAQGNCKVMENKLIEYKKSFTILSNELRRKCPCLKYTISDKKLSTSETLTEYLQSGIREDVGESKNYHLRPKTNTKISYHLILTKGTFDRLFTSFQKLSGSITEHQKQVLDNELFALEIEYEKYANILKQNIDNSLKFCLNHLNDATQMSQRVKYQIWKDTIDYWFADIRKKRECLSNDMSYKTEKAEENPPQRECLSIDMNYKTEKSEENSPQRAKVSFKSDMNLRGDILKSDGFSRESSELNFDDNISFCLNVIESGLISPLKESSPSQDITFVTDSVSAKEAKPKIDSNTVLEHIQSNSQMYKDYNTETQVLPIEPGRSPPLFLDNITLEGNQSKIQAGEHFWTPFNKEAGTKFEIGDILNDLESETSTPYSPSPSRYIDVVQNHFLVPETSLISGCQDDFVVANADRKPTLIKPEPESSCSTVSCQVCHEVLNSKQALETHISTKHRAKLCTLCGFIAGNVFNLEEHVNQSHKLYKACTVCAEICNSHNLCSHLAKRKNYQTINKDCKRVHQCCVCLKSFRSQELMKSHKIKHKTLYYRCDLCDKLSESLYEQNKHKSEHLTEKSKKFLCKLCYNHFETNDRLTAHIKQRHHMPINKYPDKMFCIICYFEYDDPNQLIMHLKNDHENDSTVIRSGEDKKKGSSSHQCRFCDIYCASLKMREVHVITAHGTAPYECVVCQATFLTKPQFDVHVLKHTKKEEFRAGLKLPKGK